MEIDSIQLLGPFRVRVSGERVDHFRSHKAIALLAYLIVEKRPVARGFLSAMFWPDATPVEARGHLRRALYDLTHKIPQRVLIDHDSVSFNPLFKAEIDLFQLDCLLAAGDEQALVSAADLCRGEFLEGIGLADCPLFENWLWGERERWRRKAVATIKTLCYRHVQKAEMALALDCSWQLIKLEPWREERYRDLMILLVRNGDVASALKVYRRCQRMLAEELEVEPSLETKSLYARILRLLNNTQPVIVPDETPISGWESERAQLIRYLIEPESRLISLTGPDLAILTALAIQCAGQVNGRSGYTFIDGTYLVPVMASNSPEHLVTSLGQALRITSAGRPVSLEAILRFLHDKEALLILAGFFMPADRRLLLAAILGGTSQTKLLITGHERLNFPGEKAIILQPASHAQTEGEGPDDSIEMVDPHMFLGLGG